MRALALHGIRDLRFDSVPDPVLEDPRDALLEVTVTAVCGSDLHPYFGRETGIDPGTVVGHEYAGRVLEVGTDVESFQPGDEVVGAFSTSCGSCAVCGSGLTARCPVGGQVFGWVSGGVGLRGAQAERLRVPLADGTLLAVPEGMEAGRALLAGDVLSTGLSTAELGGAGAGRLVVVIGAGPVGLMAVLGARELGAERVICLDRVSERLELAETFGAEALDVASEDAGAYVREATGGLGADVVLEVVGSVEATRMAYELARPGATIAAAGVHTEPHLAFSPGEAYDKNLTYRAGRCSARAVMARSLEILGRGGVDPGEVVSHRMALAEGAEAYELFAERRDGCTKVLLEP